MNACEKMQIAKMNLRPCRGRDLKTLTDMALRELRVERNSWAFNFDVEDNTEAGYMLWGRFGSLRQARIFQHRAKIMYGVELIVTDVKTGIRVA